MKTKKILVIDWLYLKMEITQNMVLSSDHRLASELIFFYYCYNKKKCYCYLLL